MNKKRILSALLAVCMVFSMMLCTQADASAKSAGGIKIVFDGKKAVTLNSTQNRKHSARSRRNGVKRLGLQKDMKTMPVKHMSGKKERLLYPSGNIKNRKAADLDL